MRDRDDVVAVAQRRSPCWTRGKEEIKDSLATLDESLYGGFWRLKGGGSRKWNTPPFSCSSSFSLSFSFNGLLWFHPLLSGFFSVFGFLVFLPRSLLFVLPFSPLCSVLCSIFF